MYISDFEIHNFKSFRNSGPITFKPGINIITGQNNAGKTSLIEALTLRFAANPHRSETTVPAPGLAPPPDSSIGITFSFTRDEFDFTLGRGTWRLPRPEADSTIHGFDHFDGNVDAQRRFVQWLFVQPKFTIKIQLERRIGGGDRWTVLEPTLGLYAAQPVTGADRRDFLIVELDSEGKPFLSGTAMEGEPNNSCLHIAQTFLNNIYRFSAERFNVGQSQFGHNHVLSQNAQNLPEVLGVLNSNTFRFLQLNQLVHEVLPQIKHVSVRALPSSQIEIIVWSHDPKSLRDDLAVPLNQCGSGVGQVLAILYVVTVSNTPQTIIVDEPQSFLHPGAVRKLIEILKRFPQHQYILATHSPTVIAASEPTTLLMARQSGSESSIVEIDPDDSNDLRSYLAEIGARLEDVFGADNILWVEGQTEEMCFPRILKVAGKRSLMGTAILGIRQTGNLERRDAVQVFNLYRRLSSSNSLLPPAVAFVLDAECRTQEQRTELIKGSCGLAKFLPRRMYENYLLDSQSLAENMNQIPGFRDTPVSEQEVQAFIDERRCNLDYFCPATKMVPSEWRNEIDGARILKELFNQKSDTKVAYVKTKHSVAITQTLLARKPDELSELADFLTSLLS